MLRKHYVARLLKEAEKNPGRLGTAKKFWRVEFFGHYLRRAEKLIWEEPERALAFLEPAPTLATRTAETDPAANGADLLILAHSHLGNAFRKLADNAAAQDQFTRAATYRDRASPEALGTYLRLYSSLCIALRLPETFELINEAIALHKRGNLVYRHPLGKCLLMRGIAYYRFNQPDKVLRDFTAALNHLSITEDPISYHCALHNLTTYAVLYGSEDDVREAIRNLKPARVMLRGHVRYRYALLTLRAIFALLDFRLGKDARAELVLRKVSTGFHKMKLPYDMGLAQLYLARIYLKQGRREELRQLVQDTARLFRELGNHAGAEDALELWREAFQEKVTDRHLLATRERFFARKQPIAA